MKKIVAALLSALSLTASPLAFAGVIADTGAGSPGITGGWSLYAGQWLAGEFSVGQTSTIQSVLGWIGGGTGTATAAIYSDLNNLPGSKLYSSQFSVATRDNGWYGATGQSWILGPGTYWAAFEVDAGDSLGGWMIGDAPFPLGGYSGYHPGQGWYDAGALNFGVRITSGENAVPEPDTILLIGIACLGLIASRRKAI